MRGQDLLLYQGKTVGCSELRKTAETQQSPDSMFSSSGSGFPSV